MATALSSTRESFARRIYLQPRLSRPTAAEALAVQVLALALARLSDHIRRVSVRIAQSTDKGVVVDKVCHVHIALRDAYEVPSFLVEGRGETEREAAELAARAARRAVLASTRGRAARRVAEDVEEEAEVEMGSPVVDVPQAGERSGPTPRSRKTARPARGRHVHKTQRQARATSSREVSAGRPSRKSTRKSSNRSKRSSNQALRHTRAIVAPEARAARAASNA